MARHPIAMLAFFAIAQGGCLDARPGAVAEPGPGRLAIVVAPAVVPPAWGGTYAVTDVTYAVEVLDVGGDAVWTEARVVPGGDGAPSVATFDVPAEALVGPPGGGPAIRWVRLTVDDFETDFRGADIGVVNPAPSYAPFVERVEVPPGEARTVSLAPAFALGGGWFDPDLPPDLFQLGKVEAICHPGSDDGARDPSVRLGLGYFAGPTTDPHLYLDDVIVACDDIAVALGTGEASGVDRGPTPPFVSSAREEWSLQSSDGFTMARWGIAIAFAPGALPDGGECVLRLRAAGAPRALAGDLLVPDATWGTVRFEVPLRASPDGPPCEGSRFLEPGGPVRWDDAPQAPFAHVLP